MCVFPPNQVSCPSLVWTQAANGEFSQGVRRLLRVCSEWFAAIRGCIETEHGPIQYQLALSPVISLAAGILCGRRYKMLVLPVESLFRRRGFMAFFRRVS